MKITYEIKFLDYWHLGSGLSAGAKLDSSVTKDSNNIAFVPGKTLKGMVRDMAELFDDEAFISKCFGEEGVKMGACFFSNATLNQDLYRQTVSNRLQDYLYDEITSTKIENGMVVNGSLREAEVVIPLSLQGEIENIPNEFSEKIEASLKMIKRMGSKRNRGLGRCTISIKELS